MRTAVHGSAARGAVILGLAVFLVAGTFLGVLEAKESEEARVRARVREYAVESPGAIRRDLVVRELAGEDPALVARIVREAALSDARRVAALELAARLRAPGTWDLAKRWADGPAEPQALALAAAAPEPEAGAWLVARWAAAAPSDSRARAALDAMRTHRLSPRAVALLGPHLGDETRAAAVFDVLRVQMAVDDECPAALRARWEEAWATYESEAREFPRAGEPLLSAPGWRLRGARAVGRNLRLAAESWIDVAALPTHAQVEPGTFRLRIRAGPGGGAFVSLATEGGVHDLRLRSDGSRWFLVEGGARAGARVDVPFRPGEWTTIAIRVTDPAIPARPGVRDLRVSVDGAELRPSGGWWRLGSPPLTLAIGAAEGAVPTVVGGVEWTGAGR